MKSPLPCGQYLDRGVTLIHSNSFTELDMNCSLYDATVLICLWNKQNIFTGFRDFISGLNRNPPLAIMVTGEDCEYCFDKLLVQLSVSHPKEHIMTYICDNNINECIEEFFLSAWPSEDRFDSWRSYLIISVGNNKGYNKIFRAIKKCYQ